MKKKKVNMELNSWLLKVKALPEFVGKKELNYILMGMTKIIIFL